MTESEAQTPPTPRSGAAKLTPDEVAARMRNIDGFAGAAGLTLSDPRLRGIVEGAISGEITHDEARRQILTGD